MNHTRVYFHQPQPLSPPPVLRLATRTGQAAETAQTASFFDALRAVTPTLIITGIAIGLASGLGTTIGAALGTMIVSRLQPQKQRR